MARIIMVEDDEILAEIMAERLAAAGHMVSVVHHGDNAMRAIDEGGPDLLVLDYDLPGRSGLDILRDIRAAPHGDDLPVVMMSAKAGRLVPARAHHDGVDDYLVKPVTPDMLLGRVEALLKSAALARVVSRKASAR